MNAFRLLRASCDEKARGSLIRIFTVTFMYTSRTKTTTKRCKSCSFTVGQALLLHIKGVEKGQIIPDYTTVCLK